MTIDELMTLCKRTNDEGKFIIPSFDIIYHSDLNVPDGERYKPYYDISSVFLYNDKFNKEMLTPWIESNVKFAITFSMDRAYAIQGEYVEMKEFIFMEDKYEFLLDYITNENKDVFNLMATI